MNAGGARAPVRPVVRPATFDDLDGLSALAALTGGGMTNLPDDHDGLKARIRRSVDAMAADIVAPDDEYYLLVLDDGAGGIIGTASLFSRLGACWPFYSFKASRVSHVSFHLRRTFSTQLLHLVNDSDGASEVGGLFLHPDHRSGGLGSLLARSRYLFIRRHRARFGDRVIADLRGWVTEGRSPFWDAVAGPFFGNAFHEADRHNALHGNQFIADLMPRYPIYATMLPEAAQAAIGRPHDGSVPALRMLLAEGFEHDGYCDIFDAGPTLCVRTDRIRTIRLAAEDGERSIVDDPTHPLVATGLGAAFEAWIMS